MSLAYTPRVTAPALLWIAFYCAIIVSWCALFLMVRANPASDIPTGFWASLCISAAAANPFALIAMWGVMSAAMMLPTFVPALHTFLQLSSTGATNALSASMLVTGYLGVWIAAAVGGGMAQWGLAGAGLVTPDGTSASPWLTVALLLVAGGYQFSAIKDACLTRCRMPLAFFMQRWRAGLPAALRMGGELGIHCLGCCWALMALGFVGGTMNLAWMGVATLFMVLEKLPEIGRYLTRPAGAFLLAAAVAVAFHTLTTV